MKPKKQHYVPQFLLRNFATGHKSKAKIWVLDKRSGSTHQASVRDVAHENRFYEYHGDAGNLEYEDLMQKIDSIGGKIINEITAQKCLPESQEDRTWLSYYIATQIIRTPSTREDMENFRQLIIRKFGKDIKVHPDDPKTIGEYGPEDAKVSSLRLLQDVPRFAGLLQEKVWCLSEAPRTSSFVVSDNPVVRHNMLSRWPRGNLGLKNDGIEIYLPVSPRLCIQVIDKKLAAVSLMTPELATAFMSAIGGQKPFLYKPENVEFANSLQVSWSERFVYAQEREHLDMPLDMLRTDPELKHGRRVRQMVEIGPPPES